MRTVLFIQLETKKSVPLADVDSSVDSSGVSSEESTLPALIGRGGDSSSEDSSKDTHVGLPSHGWDLETYESFCPESSYIFTLPT